VALSIGNGTNTLATGDDDGCIKLWDLRQQKVCDCLVLHCPNNISALRHGVAIASLGWSLCGHCVKCGFAPKWWTSVSAVKPLNLWVGSSQPSVHES
jgi:WD40 repeat protein